MRKGTSDMTRDMTRGSIPGHLIHFSFPLLLGNLFQLTYNAVDSVIIGQFAGTDALAAVGCANPVINLMILGINGICLGASSLMGTFFGARKFGQLKREAITTILLGLGLSLGIMLPGVLFTRQLLLLSLVPEEIIPMAEQYLRLIFLGTPFTFLYNAYAAAMRSIGDSLTPLKFLALASVCNVILDLILVAAFSMGVCGAAMATVAAEGSSALLCMFHVKRKVPFFQWTWKEFQIDKELVRLTLQHGSVTALQQSCQPIGKLLIQGCINSLGVEAIAVFHAVGRVEDFALLPEQNISHGMMAFISQNRGAGQKKRMKQGLFCGLKMEAGYWAFICLFILVFRIPVLKLFLNEKEAIQMGEEYLVLMAFFYLLPAVTNGIQGFFRGIGKMQVTLMATLLQISVRVVMVFILIPRLGLPGMAYASLAGWFCMLIAETPFIFKNIE